MVEVSTINRRTLLLGGIGFTLSTGFAFARDAKWARPLVIEGLPNLNLVAPNLYRSAQPTAMGFEAAEIKLKIQTVISLRNFHSDAELLKGTHLVRQSVPMNAWHITNDEILAALKLIKTAQANGPVLVHCQHGADRTGVVIAMYRIVYQGWSKQQALDEMENGGFNFHAVLANIPNYVTNVDVEAIKIALKQ
jgi:protein tyrosine/serine phosphatase